MLASIRGQETAPTSLTLAFKHSQACSTDARATSIAA
jgi:hypothetical protein